MKIQFMGLRSENYSSNFTQNRSIEVKAPPMHRVAYIQITKFCV